MAEQSPTPPPQIAAYLQRHRDHHRAKGGGGGQAPTNSATPTNGTTPTGAPAAANAPAAAPAAAAQPVAAEATPSPAAPLATTPTDAATGPASIQPAPPATGESQAAVRPPAADAPAVAPAAAVQPIAATATPSPVALVATTPTDGATGPASVQSAPPATGAGEAKVKPEKMFDGKPVSNPFEAPEAKVEIEKLAVSKINELAAHQAQNCSRDFTTALEKVRRDRTEKARAAKEAREKAIELLLTIALMPAGPVVEAAAAVFRPLDIQTAVMNVIADNASKLEQRFGSRGAAAANTAFDAVSSPSADKLIATFDPAKAKKALDRGVDTLKGKAVKFMADSDEGKCINSFLDALMKSANDSMHNLTDVILGQTEFTGATAYYNLFRLPLQASYEAAIGQSVDHMLEQLKDILATKSQPQVIGNDDFGGSTTAAELIVKVDLQGRKLLARAVRINQPNTRTPIYQFRKWVTPDMEATAATQVKEEIKFEQFEDSKRVPQPGCEPGELVVAVSQDGKDRLMLIAIEDKGFFWREYGVQTFKQWAEPGEDERVFRTRGTTQIGGIQTVEISKIRGIPKT